MSSLRTDWASHAFRASAWPTLRGRLHAARERAGASRTELAQAIASYLTARDRSGNEKARQRPPRHQLTILSWEERAGRPDVESLCAWATVLGFKCHIVLAGDNEGEPILVRHADTAEIARAVDQLSDEERQRVWAMVQGLHHPS